MNLFRSKVLANPDEPPLRHRHREPGHGALLDEIFEVWSDLIDMSDHQPAEIADLGKQAVQRMRDQINNLQSDFSVDLCSDGQDQHYLLVEWNGMRGEIGVRLFGRCLNLFGILVLPQKWGADPSPLVRMAKLNASQRRNVIIFQSLLKYVLDQTGEAIDEQRIV